MCTTVKKDKDTVSPLQVEVGSVLRLDCPVSQLVGGQRAGVMLWKKGHRVLTAGTIKVGTTVELQTNLHEDFTIT